MTYYPDELKIEFTENIIPDVELHMHIKLNDIRYEIIGVNRTTNIVTYRRTEQLLGSGLESDWPEERIKEFLGDL